jgi:protease IV
MLCRIFLAIIIILAALISAPIWGISLPDYYNHNPYLIGSASAFEDGLVGFVNPANLALLKKAESRYFWTTESADASDFNHWASFNAVPSLGFGIEHWKYGAYHVNDYRLGLGFGDDEFAAGLSYGWSSGDDEILGREKLLIAGTIIRPSKYFSLGLIGNFSLESSAKEGVAEIGVRPMGSSLLTLFADGALQKETSFGDAPWSIGSAVEVAPGIKLVGRYFENKTFTAGITVNFGHIGIASQGHYDKDKDLTYYTHSIRSGGLQPSIFNTLGQKGKRYLGFNLKGKIDYQKYAFFDRGGPRFFDILNDIKAAVADPRINTIALNLSGMQILPEHAWEIRQELARARHDGKKIIIFIDKAGMTEYHLASVADKIVLDPQGFIELYGYAFGQTYFKGTLDKLGLGFDEWRYFKYKSAVEVLSRTNMSDADREQYQNFTDDLYESVRDDICRSRQFTTEYFDRLINDKVFVLPEDAIAEKLVDTLARWSDVDKILKSFAETKLRGIGSRELLSNALPPKDWGLRPQIAIVYGLGECAMDVGIKARWLEKTILHLADSRKIKGVVFRVDSPGGDGMASDLVAEAIRKCALKKPVIISQGQVAGSGGYWISMYGDKILAGPSTITGSIGVIGGWLYDKGFSSKIGMTSDLVQRGQHADLGFGITLPFLGLRIPARNLTDSEKVEVEKIIRKFYDVFTEKVARGRKMPIEDVKKIAEGHFYSGLEGKKIGLIDEIGGVMDALDMVRDKIGLRTREEYDIVEVAKYKGFMDMGFSRPSIMSQFDTDPFFRYIKLTAENQGRPLPMLIPGTYPTLK